MTLGPGPVSVHAKARSAVGGQPMCSAFGPPNGLEGRGGGPFGLATARRTISPEARPTEVGAHHRGRRAEAVDQRRRQGLVMRLFYGQSALWRGESRSGEAEPDRQAPKAPRSGLAGPTRESDRPSGDRPAVAIGPHHLSR